MQLNLVWIIISVLVIIFIKVVTILEITKKWFKMTLTSFLLKRVFTRKKLGISLVLRLWQPDRSKKLSGRLIL
jgi:hypothetical protein